MKLQNVKIKFLEIDLKGCVYLNHFSHSVRIATFFKMISRLGNGAFWYFMLILVWIMQGLIYTVQIVYLILGSTIGTAPLCLARVSVACSSSYLRRQRRDRGLAGRTYGGLSAAHIPLLNYRALATVSARANSCDKSHLSIDRQARVIGATWLD